MFSLHFDNIGVLIIKSIYQSKLMDHLVCCLVPGQSCPVHFFRVFFFFLLKAVNAYKSVEGEPELFMG